VNEFSFPPPFPGCDAAGNEASEFSCHAAIFPFSRRQGPSSFFSLLGCNSVRAILRARSSTDLVLPFFPPLSFPYSRLFFFSLFFFFSPPASCEDRARGAVGAIGPSARAIAPFRLSFSPLVKVSQSLACSFFPPFPHRAWRAELPKVFFGTRLEGPRLLFVSTRGPPSSPFFPLACTTSL